MRMLLVLVLMILFTSSPAQVSTAFTYQGELHESALPANGSYDFEFTLYGDGAGGAPLAGPVAVGDVVVLDGLFSAEIDFGAGAFGVIDQWLEIAVRDGASTGNYTVLSPRQKVTPAPMALNAQTVEVGAVGSAEIADGSVGAVDADLNQLQARIASPCPNNWALNSVDAAGAITCVETVGGPNGVWALAGNAGTSVATDFIGTTDDVAFSVRVNDRRAMRYEWGFSGAGSPNLIGGVEANSIPDSVEASVIAGGGLLAAPNQITANYSAIGGGIGNTVSGAWSVIPGGRSNTVTGSDSVAMGRGAGALHDRTFVWNDGGTFESTANEQFLISADGGVGIGTDSPSDALHVNALPGDNALRVQTDGITRLRVHDNGGISVGVNSTPPAEGLLVRGEIEFQSPLTRSWAVSGDGVAPDGDFVWRGADAFIDCTVGQDVNGTFYAFTSPVRIPHGATVTRMEVNMEDNTIQGDIEARLVRRSLDGSRARETLAFVQSAGVPGSTTVTDTTISNATIRNDSFAYTFVVEWEDVGSASTQQFCWARIDYEIQGPTP